MIAATRPAVVFYIRELKDLRITSVQKIPRRPACDGGFGYVRARALRRCALRISSLALTRVELYQATARSPSAPRLVRRPPSRRPSHRAGRSPGGGARSDDPVLWPRSSPVRAATCSNTAQHPTISCGWPSTALRSTAGSRRTISRCGAASGPRPSSGSRSRTAQAGTVITRGGHLRIEGRDRRGCAERGAAAALAERGGLAAKSPRLCRRWRRHTARSPSSRKRFGGEAMLIGRAANPAESRRCAGVYLFQDRSSEFSGPPATAVESRCRYLRGHVCRERHARTVTSRWPASPISRTTPPVQSYLESLTFISHVSVDGCCGDTVRFRLTARRRRIACSTCSPERPPAADRRRRDGIQRFQLRALTAVRLRQIPNAITSLRILLVAPIAVALLHHELSIDHRPVRSRRPFPDLLDGFLAKRFGWQSARLACSIRPPTSCCWRRSFVTLAVLRPHTAVADGGGGGARPHHRDRRDRLSNLLSGRSRCVRRW